MDVRNEPEGYEVLDRVAPGTELREALDNIISADAGALIVIGDTARDTEKHDVIPPDLADGADGLDLPDFGPDVTDVQQPGETVLCAWSMTGFCSIFDRMGLELYSFFSLEHPDLLAQFMELSTSCEVRRIQAVADPALSPLILIPEDFSTKQGPIFSPGFLGRFHYPFVRRLVDAWHAAGVAVLYHSDGNYRKAIPDLMACGVDGFYCLEPNCGMDIVGLKRQYPSMVWAGGVDGVDTMERGTPRDVREAVRHQILETDSLARGGMFVASSSEINPPIRPENFMAMVEAVGELRNPSFARAP